MSTDRCIDCGMLFVESSLGDARRCINCKEARSQMKEVKKYEWVKSGEPVEVSMTCGGHKFTKSRLCPGCLGETKDGINCISDLLEDKEIREVAEADKMILDECVDCGCTTEVYEETSLCEGCMDNSMEACGGTDEPTNCMTFIEAIQIYDKITKSGHKVFYMHKVSQEVFEYNTETGVGTLITADIRLLTSDGWYEYVDNDLILPKRHEDWGKEYYSILTTNAVAEDTDQRIRIDETRFKVFNYFQDEALAQYIADTQLLHRIRTTLHVLNKDKFGKADRCELIDAYIRDNYGTELSRVYAYEIENAIR